MSISSGLYLPYVDDLHRDYHFRCFSLCGVRVLSFFLEQAFFCFGARLTVEFRFAVQGGFFFVLFVTLLGLQARGVYWILNIRVEESRGT